MGRLVHGDEAKEPCPSLVWDGHRYWCGVVLSTEGAAREKLVENMAIGAGCGSSMFNSWRETIAALEGTVTETEYVETFYRRLKNGNC